MQFTSEARQQLCFAFKHTRLGEPLRPTPRMNLCPEQPKSLLERSKVLELIENAIRGFPPTQREVVQLCPGLVGCLDI